MLLGDSRRIFPLGQVRDFVRTHLRKTAISPALESARDALIAAGQLEQALADREIFGAESVTDAAGEALIAAWHGLPASHIADAANRACVLLDGTIGTGFVSVKTPEGFAFYALYPEQLIDAAELWSARRRVNGRVLVIGIRSIGTALSAVVKTALSGIGWEVQRLTVRPGGEPFARVATVPGEALAGCDWVIIVDEGPGMSGSSMAAVASACESRGVARERIAWMPSHHNGPGPAASGRVRALWGSIPAFVGRRPALAEIFAAETERILGKPVTELADFSGGLWRNHLYPGLAKGPAVCPWLERMKFRCRTTGSDALLWKFAGFRGVLLEADDRWRYVEGLTAQPVAESNGFVATTWVRGRPVRSVNDAFLERVGGYLATEPLEWLSEQDAMQARERLTLMVEVNLRNWLGEQASRAGLALWSGLDPKPAPLCADPRLGLHEWLLCSDGDWVKTDASGHLHDHTVLGCQPLEWGVAATCNACNERRAMRFIEIVRRRLGRRRGDLLASERIKAFRIAHAAFRLGELELALGSELAERQARIWREIRSVRRVLRSLLGRALPVRSGQCLHETQEECAPKP